VTDECVNRERWIVAQYLACMSSIGFRHRVHRLNHIEGYPQLSHCMERIERIKYHMSKKVYTAHKNIFFIKMFVSKFMDILQDIFTVLIIYSFLEKFRVNRFLTKKNLMCFL